MSRKNIKQSAQKKLKQIKHLTDKHIQKLNIPEKLDKVESEFDLTMDAIGEHIKKLRKARNLTQTQLGELIGVQRAQISKLEKSAKNATILTLQKIFKALDADIKLKIETPKGD